MLVFYAFYLSSRSIGITCPFNDNFLWPFTAAILLQHKAMTYMLTKYLCSGLTATLLVFTCGVRSHAQVAVSTPEQVSTAAQKPYIKQQYDEDAFTWYGVTSDDKNIYVHLAVKDSVQKRKLLQNGMELWVDSKGKKNKVTGIMFPLGEKVNMYPGGGNRNAAGGPPPSFSANAGNGKNADSILQQLISKQKDAELKGFAGDINGRQPLEKLQGFTIALGVQHDTLMYDAAIPFSSLAQAADKGTVSIGIFEKGIEMPGFDGGGPGGDGDGPGGGGPPGGGGGPPPGGGGFGPPGDGPPGGGIDFKRLFQTNVIWYKLKLLK